MTYLALTVVLILFGLFWSFIGIVIGKKLYNNVRTEDHQEKGKVIQRVMKTYAIAQCIGWPCCMSLGWILFVNKTSLNLIQPVLIRYVIASVRFLYTIFRWYIGFNSLIIAICRYTFIVYDNLVLKFGINRIRYLYLSSSVGIPILIAFMHDAAAPMEHAWICMFMPDNNQTYQGGDSIGIFCTKNIAANTIQSPIYNVLNEYMSPSVTYVLWIVCFVLIVITNSNFIEGFIYLHIFINFRR